MLEPVALSFAGDAKVGDQPQHVSVLLKDEAQISRAKPCCRFGQRIEHRLQIERGAADDPEHICSGGLLLQRFSQLVEEPRVLDGDDSLGSKVFDQLDLLVGEGTVCCCSDSRSSLRSRVFSMAMTAVMALRRQIFNRRGSIQCLRRIRR
jgi:hypothetical protein